jgi:hypothetical protein
MGSVAVTATAGGNVSDVETVFATCTASITPVGCEGVINAQTEGYGQFGTSALPVAINLLTERTLNGPAGTPTAPVAYSPGQTIAVSVTISFSSGS